MSIADAWRGDFRAYCYLTLAFLFMALNIIVGRAAHTEIPPLGLSFWRWLVAALLFLPFSVRHCREQWPLIRRSWRILLLVSIVMVPLGNNLIYVGLQDTTALNGGLIPVARPAIILLLSWFLFRGTVTRYQWMGIGIAVIGVVTVLTRGDPTILLQMDLNQGDLWLVGASMGIALYQTLIGRVPRDIHPMVLLQVTMVLGALMMVPPYMIETLAGRPVVATWKARRTNSGIRSIFSTRINSFDAGARISVCRLSWVMFFQECRRWLSPISATIGVPAFKASTRAVTRFVAPGPSVASTTPTRPVTLA